jgi:hypothetical protein
VAFDGRTGISTAGFYAMLDALLPRAGLAPWAALPWRPRIHPVFFVHRVTGLAAGLYALPRRPEADAMLRAALDSSLEWEPVADAPDHLPLRRLACADVRETAEALSCHQSIAADSCFAVAMLAEFRPVLERAPWRYRTLYWEAGMLGQVLYLEAEAAGLRGTGIGCFFDDGTHRLLGIGDDAFQDLYHFTVGGAVEDRRLVTLPPYRHLVRRPT